MKKHYNNIFLVSIYRIKIYNLIRTMQKTCI